MPYLPIGRSIVVLCATLLLLVGWSAIAQTCPDISGRYECINVGESTYKVMTPQKIDPEFLFPTVVIFHDAGHDSDQIFENERVTNTFIERGFAVLAPNAFKRKNLRITICGDSGAMSFGSLRCNLGRGSAIRSKRTFVMRSRDGKIKKLEFEKNTGWYYYNIDLATYVGTAKTAEYIGIDEIARLRSILQVASKEFSIDPKPVLIIGIGHGGSLVWQIACHAPALGRILAPVGGAYWRKTPSVCAQGANLVHTHYRGSKFWPFGGAKASRKIFARTSIESNLRRLASANFCDVMPFPERNAGTARSQFSWPHCAKGSVELMLIDEPFDFQAWWLDDMIARVNETGIDSPRMEPDEPIALFPKTLKAGDRAGLKGTAEKGRFKKTGEANRFQQPGTGPRLPIE